MRKLVYVVFVVLFVMSIFYSCFNNKNNTNPQSLYLNHASNVTYVGKEVCKSCHADIYKTFIETGMGQSWGLATHEKSSGQFNVKSLVYDTAKNLYYFPKWNKDTLQVLEFRLEGNDTIHKRLVNIKYIVGSGQHTNSHLYEINGFLYQAPLTYYTQQGHWNLPPGFEAGNNSRFSRAIEPECISCHNALPFFDEQSQNKYSDVPLGLSCERCHGPGSLHVEEKQKGNLVDIRKDIDYTIVNPSKLPWQLQIDLCQRCHLQGNAVLQNGKNFMDFRPGMKLSSIADVYMPRFEGDDSKFIMASHAERLQKSQCFGKSNAKNTIEKGSLNLTCITCHNPHISVKVTGKEVFNNACKNCHQEQKCSASPELLKKENNNCVKCHMPQNGTTDIPHVTVHDHYIRKPVTEKQINAIQKFVGISCVNNPSPSAASKAEGYLNYFEKFDSKQTNSLDSAYYYLQQCNERTDLWIHYYYLKQNYSEIVQYSKTISLDRIYDAWTTYRIAESFIKTNDLNAAEIWINKTITLKPKQLNFLLKAGNIAYNLGKVNEAQEHFESILSLNPQYAEAWNSIGLIICNQGKGNLEKAMQYYNKALSLDPDLESALINSLDVFNATGDKNNFLKYLKRLYKLAPNNPQLVPMYRSFKLI